ncbi:DNA translocase FtsK 4TM domain-containing protein, partial [Escherichia coli]|nr:DNA translocase FtsK 4TM domain-containing protein [Escherichia coli]
MLEATGEVNRSDLGGGMVGAVMFAMFYYLFDSLGTELIASLLIVIGVLLITGRSLHETLRKVLTPIVRFLVTELKEGWG